MPAGEALADDLRGQAEVGGAAGAAEMRDVPGEVVVRGCRTIGGHRVRGSDGGLTGGGVGRVGRVGAGLAAAEW